jgi:AcrR family transcriptional regulator
MPRWEPGARERLQATTLELFTERGFEATTVAEIASRAGLTERTFFRYFADKREVLFTGQDVFEGMFVDHIVAAPADVEPFGVVTGAVRAVAADFFAAERRRFSRQRQTIIDANPGLQERELLKLAGLTTAMADALRKRGTPEPIAKLGAECGVTVFRVAFSRWLDGSAGDDMAAIVDTVLADLRELTTAQH